MESKQEMILIVAIHENISDKLVKRLSVGGIIYSTDYAKLERLCRNAGNDYNDIISKNFYVASVDVMYLDNNSNTYNTVYSYSKGVFKKL